ncbi:MAG: ribonuclease Y [Deferribacterota bacterium]|nr:ribonuclease Y [Deferribacterota bacterium]
MGELIVIVAVIALVAFVSILTYRKIQLKRELLQNKYANDIIENAKREAREIIKEAEIKSKELMFQTKQELDKEEKQIKKELNQHEKRLIQKEDALDRKQDILQKKEEELDKNILEYEKANKILEEREKEFERLRTEYIKEIEKAANMTREEAKEMLVEKMIDEAKLESAKYIREIEEETNRAAEKKARNIIATSIQRIASDYVGEIAVSVVNLPNDEMKGRIIGREGRNIRTFENITCVDIIVDDTPEAVIISSYDPFRRAIASLTLTKLIADGRIHPARIEEMYEKSKKEIEKEIIETGEEVIFELGINNVHKEIVRLIGRLKYRSSYGQNALAHSIEVAKIAGIMAAEIGADRKLAIRAGLLHDIGKAVDQDVEGTHVELGYDIAKKYGEGEVVLNAIMSHHGYEDFKYIEAVLVQAADAISASRPGARREVLESYIKRLENLEKIASSFEGVSKSYAIQAGREVRIIVEPDRVSDSMAVVLSKEISKKIESELTYPGQIKVTVVRESRAVEYAK